MKRKVFFTEVCAVLLLTGIVSPATAQSERLIGTYTAAAITDSVSGNSAPAVNYHLAMTDIDTLWVVAEGSSFLRRTAPRWANLSAVGDTIKIVESDSLATHMIRISANIPYTRLNIVKLAGGSAKSLWVAIIREDE